MTEAVEPAIVYLDADEEITSAAARLRRIEGDRVVFVLPYGSRLATSRINFRLLAREAAGRGKLLEIVAADASARALAGSAGLSAHASVAAFEGRDAEPPAVPAAATGAGSAPGWPVAPVVPAAAGDATEAGVLTIPREGREPVPLVGRRRSIVRPRTAIVLAVVLLLVVGGGGLAAFLYLPSATIVLHPASQALGPLELSVVARTDVASADPSSLVVPAHQYAFDLQASQTFTTTGKKVTDTAATGNVTFTWFGNQTAVTIRAGSQVSTAAGVAFVTQATITIRKAHVGSSSTGRVSVTAVVPGTAGNVAGGAITQIPPNQDTQLLSVSNPQPTSGGTHEETPQVSQQDVDAATATLTQALRDDLAAQIGQASGIPAGTSLLESTGKVGPATPSVDPATLVGQAVATFDLGLTASGTVVGVDTAPVQALAAQRLAGRVTSGWQLVDGTTSINVGRPIVMGDTITFPVTARALEVHAVDRAALLNQLKGLDLPQARALLDA
ncbi:MAG TPA: baseplate J/gp47 family protein, partial [Candidatus Limnocylindrales bacterium]|nr:baseplate J/gp47 family protein [Candidatus Limnocylindrales bacterium]